jgi:hypothetical protein
VEKKGPDLQDLICHIFSKSGSDKTDLYASDSDESLKQSLLSEPEPYEKIFPDLFLY